MNYQKKNVKGNDLIKGLPETAEIEKNTADIVVPDSIPVPVETANDGTATGSELVLANDFLSQDKVLDLTKCPVQSAADFYKENPEKPSKIDLKGLSLILTLDIMAFIVYLFDVYAVIRMKALYYIHSFIVNKLKYIIDFALKDKTINSLYHIYSQYDWKNPTNMNCLRFAIRQYLVDRGIYPKGSFDDDVWVINDMFKIAEDRRSNNSRCVSFRFDRIKNKASVDAIKTYIKYLVLGTTLSIDGNILQRLHHLTEYANMLGEVSVINATHDDIVRYIGELKDTWEKPKKIYEIRDFYEYLVYISFVEKSPIKQSDLLKQKEVKFKKRATPETVVLQIFDKLPTLPEWAMIVFLCLFCTGMRIGEVLSLKQNCLIKKVSVNSGTGEAKTEWSLRWRVSKTKVESIKPIPDELALLLEKFIEENSIPATDLLFPSPIQITQPIGEKKFSQVMNKFMTKNEIRMPNGEIYRFKAHDFRHYLAVKMDEMGVVIYYIAKILNHRNCEMTIHYLDNPVEKAGRKMKNFFDNCGRLAPLQSVPKITDEESVKEWMEKHGNAKLVQDGFCDRSNRLGKCSRNDDELCITCEWYRTSAADLDAHRARVTLLTTVRETAVENGQDMYVAQIDRELEIRSRIIEALEKGDINNG